MNIIDISHDISALKLGFPQEPITTFSRALDISHDCPVRVSQVSLSSHASTHVDAPSHYDNTGMSIDRLALDAFIGSCVVIDVMHVEDCITVAHLQDITLMPRVLFKTQSNHLDFTAIASDCVAYLAHHGVLLIGTSAISIDPIDSKALHAHHACHQHQIQIVECLKLEHVAPGVYTFIGLPLKLIGLDASPIRAVLIQDNQETSLNA